ncbi:hypothetical protein [Caldivirga maquilingensis]|uniref:hypothetical protein n=1 Tax=Caldivirga maquilingensis TaxID=76887 RepID=UPI0000F247E0|nr:hypothetical protein [Caldivirga maquilingensis]
MLMVWGAYQDGNGTFFIDSCIEFNNYGGAGDGTAIIGVSVNNFIDYSVAPTMVSNGGFEDWQLGAMDYYTGYEDYVNGLSSAFFGSGGGVRPHLPPIRESISLTTPQVTNYQALSMTLVEGNFTWVFKIKNGHIAEGYYNAFGDSVGDAELFIPSFNPSNSYVAFLPVDFENLVVTSKYWVFTGRTLEPFCTYKLMWTDVLWNVVVTPITQVSTGSYLFNFNNTFTGILIENTPPNSYLTGLTTGTTPCYTLPSPP